MAPVPVTSTGTGRPVAWDENAPEPQPLRPPPFDLSTLDDGRCHSTSWRPQRPAKVRYESVFGPGGYNRCVGSDGHANPLHKDEWGNVFRTDPFRVTRHENPSKEA